ncbi:oligosaccharide flippase family protein [Providencia rettgeri]|uniref:lipopolysaccharide biosynthesis protein n=1 Tax=Providencia rettgeri TaxID=587 RepID=UPI0028814FCA|nr:oligosaccharide flippase family protein [Providencia rettgeri]ELM3938419.1 oligosaccharide flippase family protein [Providencia rettgeri]EMA4646041.1 oligosaccharide flippase family protein [Providencia rettgeri]MDK3110059.1 oligosaccharide flippase family protein [Providencia rettgeri]WRR97109.1 oligosaccharide flippase family protein [Providencia rettgeri]
MSLIKNSSIYLTANILNSVVPFLLIPILTHYLTIEEYGQIAMFQMLISGLSTLVGLNTVGSANRRFFDNTSHDELKEFNGSCIQILIFSSIICFLISYIMANQLSVFLSISINWIYIAIIVCFLLYITNLLLGQWQVRNEAKKFGILQVGSSIINMILSLQFVILLNHQAEGRVEAQLITATIIGIVSIVLLYKEKLITIFIFKPKQIQEAALFGIPLIPHHIGIFLISSVDRFFINKDLGIEQAGIYMVAVQLSSVLAVCFDAINKAYVPWLFNKLRENNFEEKKKIVKLTYIYFLLLIIISIFSFLIGPFLLVFIAGSKYSESGVLIGWLCLGQIFGGMYLMVTNYIFFSKKTSRLALTTISTGIINVILLIVLIPYVGLLGAAYAFVISKFLQFILTWFAAYSVVKMPWFIKKV